MSDNGWDYLNLSIVGRFRWVGDIGHSIATERPDAIELSSGERDEIARRLDDHDAEPAEAVAWKSVRAELLDSRLNP